MNQSRYQGLAKRALRETRKISLPAQAWELEKALELEGGRLRARGKLKGDDDGESGNSDRGHQILSGQRNIRNLYHMGNCLFLAKLPHCQQELYS